MLATPSYRRVVSRSVAFAGVLVAVICSATARANEPVFRDPTKIVRFCQEIHQVTPPPPPVEAVLIGTFDHATDTFTWGPTVYAKKNEDNPFAVVDVRPAFENLKILAIQPNLDPKITSLGSAWARRRTWTR